MVVVVTDTGLIWNHQNPYLKLIKDIVVVVCLEGKEVTDKYYNYVVPIKTKNVLGMGKTGEEDAKYQALAAVAGNLEMQCGHRDDIVFLTDNEPTTLYPYLALKKIRKRGNNRLHLVAMSPWTFEGKLKNKKYYHLMSDLSRLDSLFYLDGDSFLKKQAKKITIADLFNNAKNYMGEYLPTIINGIHKMHEEEIPYFFDFEKNKYVPLIGGFTKAINKKSALSNKIDFDLYFGGATLGMALPMSYPLADDTTIHEVERLIPRLNGKIICNMLRQQRIALAEANGIENI